MEEVEDIVPDEEVQVVEIPEPPPLKRPTNAARKLTDKVACEGCGKTLPARCYKYSHRCKARALDEPVPEAEPPKKKR